METLIINVLNPKAKSLLKNLADLKLISIRKESANQDLKKLLNKLRLHSYEAPSPEEIAAEVEEVREHRYEKNKGNS